MLHSYTSPLCVLSGVNWLQRPVREVFSYSRQEADEFFFFMSTVEAFGELSACRYGMSVGKRIAFFVPF